MNPFNVYESIVFVPLDEMPKTVTIDPPKEGDILYNVEDKVFPDHQAEKGDKS